jgi:hypothetical protein
MLWKKVQAYKEIVIVPILEEKKTLAKFWIHRIHQIRYLGGVLAPSRNFSILIETPLASKASGENDMRIAPMGLTNLQFWPTRALPCSSKIHNALFFVNHVPGK